MLHYPNICCTLLKTVTSHNFHSTTLDKCNKCKNKVNFNKELFEMQTRTRYSFTVLVWEVSLNSCCLQQSRWPCLSSLRMKTIYFSRIHPLGSQDFLIRPELYLCFVKRLGRWHCYIQIFFFRSNLIYKYL